MPRLRASSAELQRLWESAQDELRNYLEDLVAVVAQAAIDRSQSSQAAIGSAVLGVRERLSELNALGDLLGRARLLREADAAKRNEPASFLNDPLGGFLLFDAATSVPHVPFKDAIRDIAKREPRLAGTVAEVAEVYREHGFSAVQAVSESVLKRVQAEIGLGIKTGRAIRDAAEIVASMADWTKAYSHTVVRTNLTSAYTAGRFQQLADPTVRRFIPALQFVSVREPWDPKRRTGTRPNHLAAHGLVAAVDDPIWGLLAPPLGYNCRCTVILVTLGMLAAMGLLNKDGSVRKAVRPRGAGPDPGFVHAGRPDMGIYAA